jgi:hypothetical protein
MREMSTSDNFKCDSIRENFGARLRNTRGPKRNPIEIVPSLRKNFIFPKCGVTGALNRDEARSSAHEIQILFLKECTYASANHFSRRARVIFSATMETLNHHNIR